MNVNPNQGSQLNCQGIRNFLGFKIRGKNSFEALVPGKWKLMEINPKEVIIPQKPLRTPNLKSRITLKFRETYKSIFLEYSN